VHSAIRIGPLEEISILSFFPQAGPNPTHCARSRCLSDEKDFCSDERIFMEERKKETVMIRLRPRKKMFRGKKIRDI